MRPLHWKDLSITFLTGQNRHIELLMRRVTVLFTLLVIIFFRPAFSQNPDVINYSIREGLPSSEVYEVFQDSNGFIWFATDHGVAKFDGYEMKVLTVKDGLTDPVVFGFTEDDHQRIWFRTYSGKLSIFDKGKITPIQWNSQLEELIQNNIMYSLYYAGGDIYFGTELHLGTIHSDGKIEKEEIEKYELSIQVIQNKALIYGLNGLSTRVKKLKINGNYYPITLTDTLTHNKVICGLQEDEQTLITINSDIFLFNGIEVKKVFSGRSSIISLSRDKEGFYWVGYTNNGTDKLKPENFTVVDQPPLLPGKSVTKVLQDHEGGMWFSTLEEGAFYTSSLKTITISLKNKTRFVTFNSNYSVIGDQKGNVSTYDLKNGNLVWEKNFESPVRSLFIDVKNQLWISTNETSIVSLEKGILKKKINASYSGFSTESDSTILAVGGLRISRLNLNGHSDYIISNSIHLKLLSDNSRLYASGRTGLEIFDSKMNLIHKPKSLSNSKITSIAPFDDDQIFIGTIGNGFHLINKNDFSINSFNAGRNFIANDVYHIHTRDSTVWISSEKGLIALETQSLKRNQIKIHNTISDKLPNDRINFFHATGNSIWAVTDFDIKIIPDIKANHFVNPIFYYELIRPQESLTNQPIEINSRGSLQLKFGFISFNNQNIYTRYRLSQDDDWTEASSRIINLQSISPGNYLLDIEFSLDNENWNKGTSLPFLVHPPWWNTWYFRIATGLIALVTGAALYKRRVARYKEKNTYLSLINEQQKKLLNAEIEATDRERSRIAKDLHDGIGMDLVSIKLMANQIAKKTENKDALEIQDQLQKTISEIQHIIYNLTPSGLKLFGLSYGLDNYISMVSKNHPTAIHLDFQGDEVKDAQTGAVVFRIIQELITNSIKHSQCETISIHINVSAGFIQINYSDNGIGFYPDHVKPGLGLSNIQSRVESLGGQINVESGRMGTSYSINLPLKSQRESI